MNDNPNGNKDSLFSSVFTQPQPAAAHVPAPPPRPAVSEEQVSALNRKIELMERNIVGEIEKRLARPQQPPPPPPSAPLPPPQPSPVAPALLEKMGEMERRFKDFQEKFLLGAAQMKNIEESKISARREIEELLKAVREQQKYSELDRQMHAQLEKAWSRVEEMEKRLVEAYGAASGRPADSVSAGALAGEMYKLVENRLEERLRPLEMAVKQLACKVDAVPGASGALEARLAELSVGVDARLAAFAAETQKLSIGAFAGKERLEDAVAELRESLLSCVRAELEGNSRPLTRRLEAAELDARERTDALAKLMVGHIDALSAEARQEASRRAAAENKLLSENAALKAGAAALHSAISEAGRETSLEIAASLEEMNRRQAEVIRESCVTGVSGLSAVESAAASLASAQERLAGILAALKTFTKGLEGVSLEGILGVSGAMVRVSYETASGLIKELEPEVRRLAEKQSDIDRARGGLKR